MPRAVKGKAKPSRVGAGEAANLLDIVSRHGLAENELLRVLSVEKVPCDHIKSPCPSNKKANVACFCQLVPAETSFRKKGLWQKEQAHMGTLGHDPADDKREEQTQPAGLRNLGNTCYANAALQCLFSIPSLRNAIYKAEAPVAAHDIFRQLQTLFLHMQFGPRSSVDTEALAKTLGLDHAIQQDGQEFLKLLLTRVEQLLSRSNDQAATSLIPHLFRGGLSYVTTCQRCGRDSSSSQNVQDFYDLMPQVRGFTSLTQSLASFLHAESLTGDNRYLCDFCEEKVDALRHVRLRSLPPYLCLALQRFYFDPRTADKAKASDKFGFPLELDFTHVLAEAAAAAEALPEGSVGEAATTSAASAAQDVPQYIAASPRYQLVGILIHKGPQASSGHYVAHIKDQASGQWWRYDDETAEIIGPHPTAKFQSDHGVASTSAAGGSDVGKTPARKRAAGSGENGVEDPDYCEDDEAKNTALDEDEGEDERPARGGKGSRGSRKRAPSRATRGRAAKRQAGAGGSRGRGRGRAAQAANADSSDDDGDEEMARALAASRAEHDNGRNGGDAMQDDEDNLRRALEASLQDSREKDAATGPEVTESTQTAAAEPLAGVSPTGPECGSRVGGRTSEMVSANAYMLVYRAVGFDEPAAVQDAAELPEELQQAVAASVAAFQEECDNHQQQREALKAQLEARCRSVREVLAVMAPPRDQPCKQQQGQSDAVDLTACKSAPNENGLADSAGATDAVEPPSTSPAAASPSEPSGYWVSMAWLERWANDEGDTPPIDNSVIACSTHTTNVPTLGDGGGGSRKCSSLDPRKVTAAKLVSAEAWSRLQAAHGGGPALPAGEVCRECLANHFNATLLGSQADVMRQRVAALLGDQDDGEEDNDWGAAEEDAMIGTNSQSSAARRYWVSRTWLQGWSRRSGASVNAGKSPTADIVCPHGQLLPESNKAARRVSVPRDMWHFLRDLWRQQRLRAAQEESRGGGRGKRGRPQTGRNRGADGATTVDCLDLTSDSPAGKPSESTKSGGAAATTAPQTLDDDDDVVEVAEGDKQQRQTPASQATRSATAEVSESAADMDLGGAGEVVAAAMGPARGASVPTQEELDAMCPELEVWRVSECQQCRMVAGQAAEAQAGTKRQLEAERAVLGGLAAELMPTLEPGERYYMVPSGWVRDWLQYVRPVARRAGAIPSAASGSSTPAAAGGSAAGAAPVAAVRPGSITDAMLRVLCPCHPEEPRLGVPLPRLQQKRNKLVQRDCDQDALRIIEEGEWLQLLKLYGAPPTSATDTNAGPGGRSRPATRAAAASGTPTCMATEGSGAEDVIVVDVDDVEQGTSSSQADIKPVDGGPPADPAAAIAAVLQGFRAELIPPAPAPAQSSGGGEGSAERGVLRDAPLAELSTWPPVCAEAVAAADRAAKEAMLSYSGVEVMVEIVPLEDLAGSFREGNTERKSRRSRKGRTAVIVSNTTTLEQLKLQVYENLSVHPSNQQLYVRGHDGGARELVGDDLSLAQHEVLPGQEIRMVRLQVVDDDEDVAGLLGEGRGRRRQVEEGFKNTALHGDLPQQRSIGEGSGEAQGAENNLVADGAVSDDVDS